MCKGKDVPVAAASDPPTQSPLKTASGEMWGPSGKGGLQLVGWGRGHTGGLPYDRENNEVENLHLENTKTLPNATHSSGFQAKLRAQLFIPKKELTRNPPIFLLFRKIKETESRTTYQIMGLWESIFGQDLKYISSAVAFLFQCKA